MNPFSSLFAIATAARNQLYDRGAIQARRLPRPVISVGNISVGGAGKTPFVILLGELLKQRGIAFDVLSRGYGRQSRSVLTVDPNGSPHQFGDEPLLIARRLECPVIVGASRYEAGILAEREFDSELHILDDGFQHRSLVRDFDIVLLSSEDLRDQLLPVGRLREPISSLQRADAVVLTGELDRSLLPSNKLFWRVRRSISLPAAAPIKPVVFCGIARPQKFIEQLRSAGVQPVAQRLYRDHHKYVSADVRELLGMRDQHGADGFITTEKDVINLGGYMAELAPVVAQVRMELTNAADALDTMLRVVSERRAKA